MRKYLILSIVIAAAITVSGCSDDSPAPDPTEEISAEGLTESQICQGLARKIASYGLTREAVAQVHDAVTQAVTDGLDEVCFLREVMGDDTKILTDASKPALIADMLRGPKAGISLTEDLLSMLASTDYVIYWPYSEDWDGVTLPCITFRPEISNLMYNTAYKLSPDGELEEMEIDATYLLTNPLWIVTPSDIAYDEIPAFTLGEREHDGLVFVGADGVVDTYRRGANPQSKAIFFEEFVTEGINDALWEGGSEFEITFASLPYKEYLNTAGKQEIEPVVLRYRLQQTLKQRHNVESISLTNCVAVPNTNMWSRFFVDISELSRTRADSEIHYETHPLAISGEMKKILYGRMFDFPRRVNMKYWATGSSSDTWETLHEVTEFRWFGQAFARFSAKEGICIPK